MTSEEDPTPKEVDQLALVEGKLQQLVGEFDLASEAWKSVAEGEYRPAIADALLRRVELELTSKKLKIKDAIKGGFQIVNKSHKDFFDEVLNFYFENSDILREKQKAGLSTDQTPINYLIQKKCIEVKLLPQTYNLHHMVSKNLRNFGNSWWGDGMENLYEQAWVYHFNAIPGNPLKRDASYFIKRAYEELYK